MKSAKQPADKAPAKAVQPRHRAIFADPAETAETQSCEHARIRRNRLLRSRRACSGIVCLASLLFLPSLLSAVLVGTVADATGTTTNATVRFEPLSNPQAEGGYVFTSLPITVTATNGVLYTRLEQGDYQVTINGRDTFEISVPNDSATHNWQDLITTQLTYVYAAVPVQYAGQVATESVLGVINLSSSTDVPVVYGTNAMNALLAAAIVAATNTSYRAALTSSASNALVALAAGYLVFTTNDGVLHVHNGTTLGGIACPSGDVSTPTFDPNGGTFSTNVTVTIACATGDAAIYYTTNGSTPDTNSTAYATPFTLSATTTVKAIGVLEYYSDSAVASATFSKTYLVYYGKTNVTTINEDGAKSLTSTAKSSATGSYSYSGTGYMYFAAPAAWSTPATLKILGFDVSIESASPYDNAFGDLYYATVTIDGVAYRVFRSINQLGGDFTLSAQ